MCGIMSRAVRSNRSSVTGRPSEKIGITTTTRQRLMVPLVSAWGPIANRPATCTSNGQGTGVGYWATDEGDWNSTNPGPDGQLYTCSAPNTWTLYYTPYAYPHPLITGITPSPGGGGGGTPPSDTTAPVRSNASPTATLAAGTTQTTLSLATDENATCKYGTTANTSYASIANTFTSTGGSSHSATITGLVNGGSYTYHVRCTDTANNANTIDFSISFSVAQPTAFSLGATITTSGTANVRNKENGTLMGTQPSGSTGIIVGGPKTANSLTWWLVDYETGVDGWSVESMLTLTASPTTADADGDGVINTLDRRPALPQTSTPW